MEGDHQNAEELRASLVKLAEGHLAEGILHEPRAYFDVIDVGNEGQIIEGHPEVFKNGEDFPVRFTHAVFAVSRLDQDDEEDDDQQLQRIGVRFVFHDQNYMSPIFQPAALWGTEVTAAGSPQATRSVSSWHFPIPFVLSARDTLQNRVRLDAVPTSPQSVSLSYTGIGMLSGRPYFLSNNVQLPDEAELQLGTTFYRNDGSEPVIVSDMALQTTAPIEDDDPVGDIRTLSLQVNQVGNGTQAEWFQGPDNPTIALMPAALLGVTQGQAAVHRFPGSGVLWEPDEGMNVLVQALGATAVRSRLQIALFGYITIS